MMQTVIKTIFRWKKICNKKYSNLWHQIDRMNLANAILSTFIPICDLYATISICLFSSLYSTFLVFSVHFFSFCFVVCQFARHHHLAFMQIFFHLHDYRVWYSNVFKYIFLAFISFSLYFSMKKIYFCRSANAEWVLRTLYHLYKCVCVYLCVSVNMNLSIFRTNESKMNQTTKQEQLEQAQKVSK